MPKVSVVVPNYNHEAYLPQRLESILNQTFQDFELILLDDCSTDGSRDVLERYRNHPKVNAVVYNNANSGSPFKQWDRGIAMAKGDWVWIAESDDFADSDFLSTLLDAAERVDGCVLAYCESTVCNVAGEYLYASKSHFQVPTVFSLAEYLKLDRFFIINVSSVLFRRDAVPEARKRILYERLSYCGDILFYGMLLEKGVGVCVPQLLNNYRMHSDSVSGQKEPTGVGLAELVAAFGYWRPWFTIGERKRRALRITRKFCRLRQHIAYQNVVVLRWLERFFGNPL